MLDLPYCRKPATPSTREPVPSKLPPGLAKSATSAPLKSKLPFSLPLPRPSSVVSSAVFTAPRTSRLTVPVLAAVELTSLAPCVPPTLLMTKLPAKPSASLPPPRLAAPEAMRLALVALRVSLLKSVRTEPEISASVASRSPLPISA